MAALSSFYRQIRVYCRGVPEVTMDYAIIKAAREFCRKTWYVKETIEVVEEAGIGFYDIVPADTTNYEIIGALAAERDGVPMYPAGQREVRQIDGSPKHFIFLPPSTIELVPYPGAAFTADQLETVYVSVATSPTLTATTVDDAITRRYDEGLAFGAIAHLANMPGESWTNDKLAMMANEKFYEAMRNAKSDSLFDHKPRNNRVYLPKFAV